LPPDKLYLFEDHVLFEESADVVLHNSDGKRIATAWVDRKAAILQSHGLLTVGATIEAAAWWFITMERSCQTELLAAAAGTPKLISPAVARLTRETVGNPLAGWFSFQPLYDVITAEQPDLLD